MRRTPLYERHLALGARMVEFAGWEMPLQYSAGIMEEHLATRRGAGLFDVSHMGRFAVRGRGVLGFLQHVLTNNAASLSPGKAQYTMVPNERGGALDDAYLYCLGGEEYLLVVNAANREGDWGHFQKHLASFPGVELLDRTEELAMLSLQGSLSRKIALQLLEGECIPEPGRNTLCFAVVRRLAEARGGGEGAGGARIVVARTGYAGESLGFELFVPREAAAAVWDQLIELGATPVGLGARDTLRLEAGLPLYGHELGWDSQGKEIPIFACPLARFAVSLSPLKGEFIGREALARQFAAYQGFLKGSFSGLKDLPRIIRHLTLLDKGVARQGCAVHRGDRQVGWVTSGTVAPYWIFAGQGLESRLTQVSAKRTIGLALLDSDIAEGILLEVDIRGKRVEALAVPYLLRSDAPPFARPILYERPAAAAREGATVEGPAAAAARPAPAPQSPAVQALLLLKQTLENTRWRQRECFNLIPSEMTASPLVRLASVMDPAFRYAEHRKVKALADADVFYYQGTGFIEEVERRLVAELCAFLGCRRVEARLLSGQMANTAVFSALLDFLNRDNRRQEPRRIRSVLNHHILSGGHLSAQPMGALKDFVARDPATEAPAVVSFPVLPDNPYRVDVSRVGELLERHRPELIVLGKSLIIHTEPVAQILRLVNQLGLDTVIMYDMAHVLGLVGPHFQEPFREGADLVTGSTHKSFFGTQRGIIASDYEDRHPRYPLWEAVERRTFPGSVSNHHLGTLLGLLMAAYEMNAFKDAYQRAVLANAKAFARALKEEGLDVAGDPELGYTQTHQVIVPVGYGRGVEVARRLERNNIIVNYQATPREEGFTAAGALRMGVAEMTRFGLREKDFDTLARLIREVVLEGKDVKKEAARLRRNFKELHYCFSGAQFERMLQELHRLI